MKQVSQKRLCGPPRTTGLKLFLKYSNFAICFLNNRPWHGIELLFLPRLSKHKNKNLHKTREIYCPKFACHVALKCDKSCKLQVKGLFCKGRGPTLKLGIPVSVGKRLDPAGTRARAPGAGLAPAPPRGAGCGPPLGICHRSPFAFLAQSPCHGLCLSSGYNVCGSSLVQLSWESLRRPDGLFKLKVSSVCLRCLKILGKLPLVVLVTA